MCKPLDIPSLLADERGLQPVACGAVPGFVVYWKLVISFPESCKEVLLHCNTNNAVSFVIRERFKRGPYPLQTRTPQALQNKVSLPLLKFTLAVVFRRMNVFSAVVVMNQSTKSLIVDPTLQDEPT